MKKAILLGFFLLCANHTYAQTITHQLGWTQPQDTLAVTNTYRYSLVIDAAPAITITPVCVQNATNVDCTSQNIVFTAANHTFKLTVTSVAGLSNTATLNYVPGAAPTVIQSIVIITKTTIP